MTQFDREITGLLPALRAFALRLSRDECRADDLTQDTLERAYAGRLTFEPGTNLKSWLFTIMRNAHTAAWRRDSRLGEPISLDDGDLPEAALPTVDAGHDASLMMDDVNRLLDALPFEQREAVLLVSVGGWSVEEAAARLGVEPGTIKSRVSRARSRMGELAGGGRLTRRGFRGSVEDHVGRHAHPGTQRGPARVARAVGTSRDVVGKREAFRRSFGLSRERELEKCLAV